MKKDQEKWIKINKKTLEKNRVLILYNSLDFVFIGYFDQEVRGKYMFKTVMGDIYQATHFIYLPESPK